MGKGTVTAYVLDERHHLQAAQEIPGFPGVFSAGRPVLASSIQEALGDINVSDVDQLIKERALPLVKVQISEADADEIVATAGPQQPPAAPEPPEEGAEVERTDLSEVQSPATTVDLDSTEPPEHGEPGPETDEAAE